MHFRKLAIVAAIGLAITGCGVEEQEYKNVHKHPDQTTISNVTDQSPVPVKGSSVYEIPLEGVWIFQQSLGDVSRTSRTTPFLYDFINNERLVTLKLTEQGLIGELIDGDVVFEGETSRFTQHHNEPTLFTLDGTYEAYECAEDSYGDCTNKEKKVSDPSVPWWEKSHFTPKFDKVDVSDAQRIFKYYLSNVKESQVTHVEFEPKNGVINIELTHDMVGRNGQPERASEFYSLIRLDQVASKGYSPIHYDLAEHDRFGFFKTDYEKLDPNYIENQKGYEGYFVNRFDPRKDKIEYHLSDEFFRKDENGNLINKVWLDATVKGFEYINNSLKDKFSPNGRLVPELVLVNKDSTEPSNIKVGDIRSNVVHIVPEASKAGLLGFGPSTSNPLTGEILSAYTIMYPGVAQMGVGIAWDELAELYNRKALARPYDVDQYEIQSASQYSGSQVQGFENTVLDQPESITNLKKEISIAQAQLATEHTIDLPSEDEAYSEEKLAKEKERLENMIANNMFPAEFSGLSSSLAANKTDITELDFFEEGLFVDVNVPVEARKLKAWSDLNLEQKAKISHAISTHQYLTTLVHEIGHNLGLRHNFKGSFDSDNFYTEKQAKSLDLKGVSATSSIMDYTPSEINVHPAFGLYDRAALRFAYQRQVAVHEKVDEDSQTKEEILAVKRDDSKIEFRDLASLDAIKRKDMSQLSALASLELDYDLQSEGLQLKDYGFCTDGRGRRASETGCLVFDEGSNSESITDAWIERYKTKFDLVNTRRDRIEFNANKRYLNKLISLLNSSDRMNMVVDDYAREYFSGDYKIPAEACSDLSTAEKQKTCDVTRAAYKQAYFYLDILKTPEKQCILHTTQELRQDDGSYVQNWQGNSDWSLANTNWLAGNMSGEEYTSKFNLPKSCFDEALKAAVDNGSRLFTNSSTGKTYRLSYEIVAESKFGNYLNKVSFSNRASHENAPSIGYEVEHLGIWMDKLVSIESLFTPSGLRGVDFALVDLPGVREEMKHLVDHWATGKALPEASDAAKEFGEISDPYAFVDAQGNEFAGVNYTPSWYEEDIRPTPGRLSWLLNRWYGTNLNASTPVTKALIYSMVRYDGCECNKPEAYEMKRYVSISDEHKSGFDKSIDVLSTTYYADETFGLASQMIDDIKKSDIFVISKYSDAELTQHQTSRENDLSDLKTAASEVATLDTTLRSELLSDESVTEYLNGKEGTAKWLEALQTQFETSSATFITYGHLWGARDALIDSGDMTWNGSCYILGSMGCMFTNDKNEQGNLYGSAITPALSYRKLWDNNNALASVTPAFLIDYSYKVASLDAIFRVPEKSIAEYLDREFGNESLRLEAVDSKGLRNLVVVDEHGNYSTF